MKEKRYIVRKYIFAASATDAIKKDKNKPVDDVYVDENWMIEHDKKDSMGFNNKK